MSEEWIKARSYPFDPRNSQVKTQKNVERIPTLIMKFPLARHNINFIRHSSFAVAWGLHLGLRQTMTNVPNYEIQMFQKIQRDVVIRYLDCRGDHRPEMFLNAFSFESTAKEWMHAYDSFVCKMLMKKSPRKPGIPGLQPQRNLNLQSRNLSFV